MTTAARQFTRTTISAAILGASLLAISTPTLAKELRMGLITPPQHIWTQTAEQFAETVAERSDGELSVSIFPAGQLGDEPAMFSQLGTGLLDMGIMTAAITSQREPSLNGWFTPFLFDSVADAAEATETPAAQQMLADLEGKGLHAFGYTFAGMRHILMRDTRVESLEDVANQKIRIIPITTMQTWWRAVGATPTPVHLPDVYQGLQNRMLDGIDIDLDALVGSGFYEVAEYLTFTNHMAFPAVSVISQATWSSLSDEERELLDEAMQEALAWGTQAQIEAEADNLAYLEDTIDVFSLEDAQAVFEEANQAFAERFGGHPVINAFQQEVTERQAGQ
ncbi:C4-dicarboxylate ABC transporter permease [Litchfieldella qijiaojingensis]|uniref:C4-dicarboxylate ABC transporter permease n=1 Tax=Litchfieldella qijiaojingensis TaxID=980347 RepID=A0ABQ2YQB8_9GAMM|nr:TRAP transporter substrate-binding protein [Halomonas qijiaojingensis]GGX91870.1 C4-dicarboxylate ABC transporter permease [Halomonas qijiaojingensis]